MAHPDYFLIHRRLVAEAIEYQHECYEIARKAGLKIAQDVAVAAAAKRLPSK
jgi:hypothetical protein